MSNYRPRRSTQRWLSGAPAEVLAVYDNGGKTADRYTVLMGGRLWDESMGRNVSYLGLSEGGRSFSQWGEAPASNRSGYGRKIKWSDLDEATQKHIVSRINENFEGD